MWISATQQSEVNVWKDCRKLIKIKVFNYGIKLRNIHSRFFCEHHRVSFRSQPADVCLSKTADRFLIPQDQTMCQKHCSEAADVSADHWDFGRGQSQKQTSGFAIQMMQHSCSSDTPSKDGLLSVTMQTRCFVFLSRKQMITSAAELPIS